MPCAASEIALRERLIGLLRGAPALMQVLRTLRDLDLPDWMVFSGAVYQPVLNHLTGRAADYGVQDYDLGLLPATLRPNGGFERAAIRAVARWPELAVAGK